MTDKPYLEDILNAINSIEMYMQDGISKEEFTQGKGLYQDAVVRNIEIIGEATKKLSKKVITNYAEVPWKEMAGMRDKVIHNYSDIDWEQVWLVATEDIKTLKSQIEIIMDEIK